MDLTAVEPPNRTLGVSVVIPTYNQAPYLMAAIESALKQTVPPDEIIVVDNASTDETSAVCESLRDRIRYIRMPDNRGASSARNAGLTAASHPIVVYLDGDDVMREDCLEARIPMIAEHPDVGLVVGPMVTVTADLQPLYTGPKSYLRLDEVTFDRAVAEPVCPTGGLVVRKDTLIEAGGWDETLPSAEDSDVLIRMAARSRCVVDREPRALYRQVQGSLSKDGWQVIANFRRMFDKNEPLSPNPARYRRLSRRALQKTASHYVFGFIGSDAQPRKLARMFAAVRKHPDLFPAFVIWAACEIRRRLIKFVRR